MDAHSASADNAGKAESELLSGSVEAPPVAGADLSNGAHSAQNEKTPVDAAPVTTTESANSALETVQVPAAPELLSTPVANAVKEESVVSMAEAVPVVSQVALVNSELSETSETVELPPTLPIASEVSPTMNLPADAPLSSDGAVVAVNTAPAANTDSNAQALEELSDPESDVVDYFSFARRPIASAAEILKQEAQLKANTANPAPLKNAVIPDWETNPELYGVRRSGRAKVAPNNEGFVFDEPRMPRSSATSSVVEHDNGMGQVGENGGEEEDSDFEVPRHVRVSMKKKATGSGRRRRKRRSEDDEDFHGDESEEEEEIERINELSRYSQRTSAPHSTYTEKSDGDNDFNDPPSPEEKKSKKADETVDEPSDQYWETIEPQYDGGIEKILSHMTQSTIEHLYQTYITQHPEAANALNSLAGTMMGPYRNLYLEIYYTDSSMPKSDTMYLIQWAGKSHMHNTWKTYEELQQFNLTGMKRLDNYIKEAERLFYWRQATSLEDIEYTDCQLEMDFDLLKSHCIVERVVSMRLVEQTLGVEYLCKWTGLPYAECTWENSNDISGNYQREIDAFLVRKQSSTLPDPASTLFRSRPKFRPMKVQPRWLGGLPENPKEGDVELTLRNYQLEGINWLCHSWCDSRSAILADEMGLGKTIQTVGFLSSLMWHYGLYGPFLVVVPLSTIVAWQREFERWSPFMNTIIYIGNAASRQRIRETEWYSEDGSRVNFNVLVTTYEVILTDFDYFNTLNYKKGWASLCVDEAHRLKNVEGRTHKLLAELKTNHRLLITGTPLQNSMKELWALLRFLMPSKFGDWESFERTHSSLTDGAEISRLHELLKPYLLRRVKKDVEKSMPSKTERILRFEMSALQKDYYRAILTKNYAALSRGSKNKPTLLNVMMELKKCCNHPFLVDGRMLEESATQSQEQDLASLVKASGKLVLLDKLLVRLKEQGHRVLIFSQMVRMLNILALYLQQRGWQFQRLDGSIRGEQRKQALDHFNAEGSKDFCFLLSTRAGGLGVNLATADTVIIFDSDWNPQNDLQAEARAHRIGQKRQVNIYRLITMSSVEEDILERAKRKMVLDHLVIQRMDTSGRTVLAGDEKTKKKGELTAGAMNNQPAFDADELNAILKFGAMDIFQSKDREGSSVAHDEKMMEMDLDDILARAETTVDAETSTAGDELLSQFKVASITFGDAEWDEIIPEKDRKRIADEEEAQRLRELHLPPRRSVPVKTDPKRSGASSALASPAVSDVETKVAPPRKRRKQIKAPDAPYTSKDIRQFVKKWRMFGDLERNPDRIAKVSGLDDGRDYRRLATRLLAWCREQLVQKTQERFEDVVVNPEETLRRDEDLATLARRISASPQDISFRLPIAFSLPSRWSIHWTPENDAMLLVGVYRHGFGEWEAIRDDPDLHLKDKILQRAGTLPQASHLQRRVELLLKDLRTQQETFRQAPPASLLTQRKLLTTAGSSTLGSTAPEVDAERKRKVGNGAEAHDSKKLKIEEVDDDDDDFENEFTAEAATIMKPVYSAISALKALIAAQEMDPKAKVALMKQNLCTIGDHVQEFVNTLAGVLKQTNAELACWTFVGSEVSETATKLRKIYHSLRT